MSYKYCELLCVGLAALSVTSAASATAVYDTVSTTAGNQGWTDILGDDFTVNVSGLKVTELGAFDSTKAGITTDVNIGLYDLTTSSWAISLIDFKGAADPAGAAFVWQSVTPYTLVQGDEYSIVGIGFNGTDQNFNSGISNQSLSSPLIFNSLGGDLTNGLSRYGGNGDPSASIVWTYPSAFGAGTLNINVPEPVTWTLMLIGMAGVGAGLRQRRREAMTAA